MDKYRTVIVKTGGLLILFCVGFIFFYNFLPGKAEEKQPTLSPTLIGTSLPPTNLVDLSGAKIDENSLREGKVVLVAVTQECGLCLEEGKFLQAVVNKRNDVHFYGVVPFGANKEVLREAQPLFPFKLFFDDGSLLGKSLNLNRVPAKIYLENGVIKRTWVGSTSFWHTENEFTEWLEALR
jgi:hypothetical protein